MEWNKRGRVFLIPIFVSALLIISGVLYLFKLQIYASYLLVFTLVVFSLPLWYNLIRNVARGHFGVDIIAGVALISALFFREYLAGVIVLLMLSGGEALEQYALERARKDLTLLLSKAPQIAHRKVGEKITDVAIEDIHINDILIVKQGEVIPIDGIVIKGRSLVDESTMTGESIPSDKHPGSHVLSGTTNQDGVLEIRARRTSKESKFEQIVKLVREAEEKKAPIIRLADRYSVYFTAITFVLAFFAWGISKDPLRVFAVLVVATPCPLILATPIAIISAISKSAKKGIIIKDGGAIEQLSEARSFVFDKTGTITLGVPTVSGAEAQWITESELIKKAASLDQLSDHVLSKALVDYATNEGMKLDYPEGFKEFFGEGVYGRIGRKKYYFGKLAFLKENGVRISERMRKIHNSAQESGKMAVYLSDEKKILGAIYFSDELRGESRYLFDKLREEGIGKIVMITGDRESVARRISQRVGIREHISQCLPECKFEKIKAMKKGYGPLVMVGDGVNDAPALAEADIGIAISPHSANVASQSASAVIVSPDISKVYDLFKVSKKTVRIAKQGIFFGIGLSSVFMILASMGIVTPIAGAIIQEGIDVVVIFNALRIGLEEE